MREARAKLTLSINYEGEDASEETIRHLLRTLVDHAAARGALSGDANMTVETWDCVMRVTEMLPASTIDQQLKKIWSRVHHDYFTARAEQGEDGPMPGEDVREVVDDNAFQDKTIGKVWAILTDEETDKYLRDAFPHEEYL